MLRILPPTRSSMLADWRAPLASAALDEARGASSVALADAR
jgi:hypothetical protein